MVFFPPKTYFIFGRKMKDDFSEETHGNMMFSVYTYKCYKHGIMPVFPKQSNIIFPSKGTFIGD